MIILRHKFSENENDAHEDNAPAEITGVTSPLHSLARRLVANFLVCNFFVVALQSLRLRSRQIAGTARGMTSYGAI
jgi:hypothetical protein